MPSVEKSIAVNASPEKVYAVLKAVDDYASFMPHVKTVQVVEQEVNRTLLSWVVVAPGVGMEIKWQSWHTWHDDEFRSEFQPMGDSMVTLKGEWLAESAGDGTQVTMRADYEAKVPPIFAGMAKKAVDDLTDGWMKAIKQRAES
jgi:ribosome-associated toxin RatA of RatAB toxin-antitoxin module